MNILFTGITGVKKEKVIHSLTSVRAAAFPAWGLQGKDAHDPGVQRKFPHADVDDFFQNSATSERVSVEAVLAAGEVEQVRRDWSEAFRRALDTCRVQNNGVEDRCIAMHTTYFWRSRPSIPVDLRRLAEFNPNAVVTLIDDCYSIWWRVKRREKRDGTGSYLRLQDILKWRQFDLWVTQQLVNDVSCFLQLDRPIPHLVWAVKHPIESLHKLLFPPRVLRVYAARPITDVRANNACLEGIEAEYNNVLRKKFAVIEPATIDEKCLEQAYMKQFGNKPPKARQVVELQRACRLALRKDSTVADEDEMFKGGALKLPAEEVYQVAMMRDKDGKGEIDLQIAERDFWLIRVTDKTVGYRPYWKGICALGSTGVIEELNMAARLIKLPRYYGPRGDRPAKGASPFHTEVKRFFSMDALIRALQAVQEEGM